MTLALQSPESVSDVVSVDNAPLDAPLRTAFAHYIRGMKAIESAGVTRLSDADAILRDYEEASAKFSPPSPRIRGAPAHKVISCAVVGANSPIPPGQSLSTTGVHGEEVPGPSPDAGEIAR